MKYKLEINMYAWMKELYSYHAFSYEQLKITVHGS